MIIVVVQRSFFYIKKMKSSKRRIIYRSALVFLYRKKLNHENANNFLLSNDLSLKFLIGTNCTPFDYDEFTLFMDFIWHCTKKNKMKKKITHKNVSQFLVMQLQVIAMLIAMLIAQVYTNIAQISVTNIAAIALRERDNFFYAV